MVALGSSICSSVTRTAVFHSSLELNKKFIKAAVQVSAPNRCDDTNDDVYRRKCAALSAKSISDHALDPVPGYGIGHRLLANHEPQPGAVHSIENGI